MYKKFIFISIIVLSVWVSCASPDKDTARNVVSTFVEGLYAQDTDAVLQVAPFFGEIPQSQKEQLYKNLQSYEEWSIEAVQIKGNSALVLVEFTKPDADVQMQFPLKAEDGTWVIQETISFSTTIDIIPAE